MASASRVSIQYADEGATPGTAAAQGAAGKAVRITSESLQFETDYTSSDEIRADRGRGRGIRTGGRVTGDLNVELSPGSFDGILVALAAQPAAGFPGTGTAIATGTVSVTDADTIEDSADNFGAIVVGQTIRLVGFTTVSNNTFAQVVAKVNDGEITIRGPMLVAEAAGAAKAIHGRAVSASGIERRAFTIERYMPDLTVGSSIAYEGCRIGSMGLRVAPAGIATATFGVLGEAQILADARRLVADPAVPTSQPWNGVEQCSALIDGVSQSNLTSIDLSVETNLRGLQEIGTYGAADIVLGTVAVSGTIEQNYKDRARLDDLIDGTARALTILFDSTDAMGQKFMAFDVPQIDITGATVVAEGTDTEILARLTFEASAKASQMLVITRP